jgi:predicted lipid-binding transport protein (Tim44 family)
MNKPQPTIISTARRTPDDIEAKINDFKTKDPNFSRIVFLDFVQLLYVKYYSYYGKREFNYLVPYLADNVRRDAKLELLISQQVIKITEIIINSVRLYSLINNHHETQISVEINANYSLHPAFYTASTGKQYSRYAVIERWVFIRKLGVLSNEPEKMHSLTCPLCGALALFTDTGQCGHCNTVIIQGENQWSLSGRYVLQQNLIELNNLVAYSDEQGTALTTQFSPNLNEQIEVFSLQQAGNWADYWQNFKQTIAIYYCQEFNKAWTAKNLNPIRHLLSDRLYEAQGFWINLYQTQGFTNKLDDLVIKSVDLVKIETDKYYQAITVRLFASCFDYTVDSNNKVIGGSNKHRRAYSEYWTFARREGVENTVNNKNCPQCTAPIEHLGQIALCPYCGAKISTGEFSWVLFLITQDENYTN